MSDVPDRPSADEVLDDVVERFTAALREGKHPSIADYQRVHPELADEIHELLSSAAMIEGLKKESWSGAASDRQARCASLDIDRLGDYRIIEEIGRGGMGVVLLGVHESLGRRVAIKVLPPHLAGNEKYAERFRREAQAAATLHHTNIVSVFGAGRWEGYHYYVMEYVEGCGLNTVIQALRQDAVACDVPTPSLSDSKELSLGDEPVTQVRPSPTTGDQEAMTRLSDTPLPPRDAAAHQPNRVAAEPSRLPTGKAPPLPTTRHRYRWAASLMAQVADALQYAHDHGKLHRDIKPSNLILDREGRVWLTDFGLVKAFAEETMTGLGEVIGTPQYMAPEAFEGTYDPRSEVYCLGLTLFELLVLKPAFPSGQVTDLVRRVTSESVPPANKWDASVPRELSTIVAKATAREPEARYATAAELREDLRAWLDGRPIAARRTAWMHRAWMWSRRNPWAALSAVLTVLVAITATAGWFLVSDAYRDLRDQHAILIDQQNRIQAATEEAQQNATRFRDQFLRAEANVSLTLEMFDQMFRRLVSGDQDDSFTFDGFQELVGVETAVTASDARFLEEMLEFFQRYAAANGDNRELQSESARAHRRVANIYHLTGQLDPAVEAYRRAADEYHELAGDDPDATGADADRAAPSGPWRLLEVRTRNEMALALAQNGKNGQAKQVLDATLQRLAASPLCDQPEYRLERARTLNLAGSLLPIEAALDEQNALTELLPTSLQRITDRRRRIDRLRNAERELERNRQSILEAIDELDSLIADVGGRPAYRAEKAKAHARLAELYAHSEQMAKAAEARDAALRELRDLVAGVPDNTEYQALLAQVLILPVDVPTPQRISQLQEGIALVDKLREARPGRLEYLQLDAELSLLLSRALRDEKPEENDAAVEALQHSLEAWQEVVTASEGNRTGQLRLIAVTLELAEHLLDQDQFTEARALLRRSIRTIQQQARGQRQPVRLVLARLYELLADASRGLGDERGVRNATRQARQLKERPAGNRN